MARTEPTTAMSLTSNAFEEGGPIPKKNTGEGQDISPALSWDDPPQGTQSFALICDDPDAPRDEPWVHWVMYNIRSDVRELPAGIPRKPALSEPTEAFQGRNSWPNDNIGYRGPMPPPGHGVHHYHFKLFALDTVLDLKPGATKDDLLDATDGHVLAEAETIGTYKR